VEEEVYREATGEERGKRKRKWEGNGKDRERGE
jgi:hypothetical protein